MMKFAFFLVGLLHLCYSTKVKKEKELMVEMIGSLENLEKLYNESKVNITSPEALKGPSRSMQKYVRRCAGGFFSKLEELLNSVEVDEDSTNILKELKANLQVLRHLGPKEMFQKNNSCRLSQREGLKPFGVYADFLRKLNSSMKR